MNSLVTRVLLVADDRALLRHLSKFLNLFDYQVSQAADEAQAIAAASAAPLELVVLAWERPGMEFAELCRAIRQRSVPNYNYTLLMKQQLSAQVVTQALEAGIDDFLSRPVIYGELLARLRAGGRVVESMRRDQAQEPVDALTGVSGYGIFYSRFRDHLAEATQDARALACAMIDIDYFERVNRQHGWPAGTEVLKTVAQRLTGLCEAEQLLARHDVDRFCVLLPGMTDLQAAAWAERARRAISEEEFAAGTSTVRLTASVGVAARQSDTRSPESLINNAFRALRTAKESGRDCVARSNEFEAESKMLRELAAPGKMFDNTAARDVMSPCALLIGGHDSVSHATRMLQQARLEVAPVIDHHGKLTGLLRMERLTGELSQGDRERRKIDDLVNRDAKTFEAGANFQSLFEFFVEDQRSEVVVLDGGRPVGMVTRDGLAALIEPKVTESGPTEKAFAVDRDDVPLAIF